MLGTDLKLTGEAAGRQMWFSRGANYFPPEIYEFNPSKNPNASDLIFRRQRVRSWIESGKDVPSEAKATTSKEAVRKAVAFYQQIQADDGHWAGDYGGPLFLLPSLVAVWYITGKSSSFLSRAHVHGLRHYLLCHQQTDGGWGTHVWQRSVLHRAAPARSSAGRARGF
jgi:hypothetical protein